MAKRTKAQQGAKEKYSLFQVKEGRVAYLSIGRKCLALNLGKTPVEAVVDGEIQKLTAATQDQLKAAFEAGYTALVKKVDG